MVSPMLSARAPGTSVAPPEAAPRKRASGRWGHGPGRMTSAASCGPNFADMLLVAFFPKTPLPDKPARNAVRSWGGLLYWGRQK